MSALPSLLPDQPRGWLVKLSLRITRWLSADLEVRTGDLSGDQGPSKANPAIGPAHDRAIADQQQAG